MTISIIGYSGHAYVSIETAICLGHQIDGYYDINELAVNPYKLTYLGMEDNVIQNNSLLFISIGDNLLRQRISNKLNLAQNFFASLVHPTAIVSVTTQISENVLIAAGAILNAQVNIGFGCIVNTGAIIEHECIIKSFAHIAPGAVLAGNIQIGERTFIGANAVLKQGIKIGNDVIIGAGSVILTDIPDNATVVGNPGRIIKK
jgi:sugar O-acyltransferase (sialic acid O-acetyltransferase NeuD family)